MSCCKRHSWHGGRNIRFASRCGISGESDPKLLRNTENLVLAVSIFVQVAVGLLFLRFVIAPHANLVLTISFTLYIVTRSLMLYLSERGASRARRSPSTRSSRRLGPVIGLFIGLGLLANTAPPRSGRSSAT